MIHELYPDLFNGAFKEGKKPVSNDYILFYHDNKAILKKENGDFKVLSLSKLTSLSPDTEMKFLGSLNENDYYIAIGDHFNFPENEFHAFDLFEIRDQLDKPLKWIVSMGFRLFTWYEENRYCGKCGGLLQEKLTERAMECEHCNVAIYPKISPAIIVAIIKGDEILLAQSVNFKGKFYSLLAGFVEQGETLEEAVKREVKEETGIDVKNIKYYKSQPWPFSGSLMIGYFAEYDGNSEIKVDGIEIVDAKWFSKNNLPLVPGNDSIAGEMIRLFAAM